MNKSPQPITQPREGSGIEIILIIPLCLLMYFLGDLFLKKYPPIWKKDKIETIK